MRGKFSGINYSQLTKTYGGSGKWDDETDEFELNMGWGRGNTHVTQNDVNTNNLPDAE